MPFKNPEDKKKHSANWYIKNKDAVIKKAVASYVKCRINNSAYVERQKLLRGCGLCGYKKCARALEFHHLKAEDKSFSLSVGSRQMGLSIKRLSREIEKCVVLCANCHREVEAGIADATRFYPAEV